VTYVDGRPPAELASAALARDAAFREALARETWRRIMAAQPAYLPHVRCSAHAAEGRPCCAEPTLAERVGRAAAVPPRWHTPPDRTDAYACPNCGRDFCHCP